MNTGEKKKEQIPAVPNSIFKTKLLTFLKKNIVGVILFLAIIIVYIWFSVKISNTTKRYENERKQLITKFEITRDSLRIKNLEFASMVFSWSVRSELLRNNVENLNSILTIFVKESGADLIQIVNPENNVVLLSSDKKFEGNQYNQKLDFEFDKPAVVKEQGLVRLITPVMGYNSKIGLLVIKIKMDK